MQPNNSLPGSPNRPSQPDGNSQYSTKDAAANIVRGQIDNIFNRQNGAPPQPAQSRPKPTPRPQTPNRSAILTPQRQPNTPTPATSSPPTPQSNRLPEDSQYKSETKPIDNSSQLADKSAYNRNHNRSQANVKTTDHWKYYHSAWQDYYRQYYERYYIGEVYRMRQNNPNATTAVQDTSASQTEASDKPLREVDDHEIFHDLRDDLLRNIRTSADKVQKSRHFMPFMAATMVLVLFLFLQYNRVIFANVEAYVSPGNIDPANIIVDPTIASNVGDEPKLIIPKINVDTPIVYDTKPDHNSQMKAMEKGVAWFGIPGANSQPGQVGNTVLSGHSSNDLFDPGEFKFIFARLEQLENGDSIYVNHKGTRHIYSVTKKEVVKPTDVHKLVYDTDKPMLTLITCVPLGTARDRLLVTAEQVSPNPIEAKEAPQPSQPETVDEAAMPGNSPSLLGRLFGSGNN